MQRAGIISGLIIMGVMTACDSEKAQQQATLKVPIYEVTTSEIPIEQDFIGQTLGKNDIDIRARVSGFLDAIYFDEGMPVKKGALLYKIDPQPFEAKVAEQASMLAQAKTAQAKAESDLRRIKPLAEKNAVSQSDLDAAQATYDASIAEVSAAGAGVRLAQIELGYTNVYAPVGGIIGITQARVGDFVGQMPNSVILNTVSEIDTIRVRFSITERAFLTYTRSRDQQQEDVEPGDGQLRLIFTDGSEHPYMGAIDFANRQIDSNTGTLLLQASFPNPDKTVRPGQSAIIRALVYTLKKGIMIPQRCVTELQGLHQVGVFKDDNTIENRKVTVGEKKGNMWIITEGLEVGEKVVLENVFTRGANVKLEAVDGDFQIIQ